MTLLQVRIKLYKKEGDWWPRLLYEQKKLPWLRVDFDRIKQESGSEDEGTTQGEKVKQVSFEDMLRTKYPDAYTKLQKEELGFINESFRKCYLFVYNLFMFCGFMYVLVVMSLKYSADQETFPTKCWETVGNIFKFLHLMMYLEVLNPLFGYTKGSVVEAMLQVRSS